MVVRSYRHRINKKHLISPDDGQKILVRNAVLTIISISINMGTIVQNN